MRLKPLSVDLKSGDEMAIMSDGVRENRTERHGLVPMGFRSGYVDDIKINTPIDEDHSNTS